MEQKLITIENLNTFFDNMFQNDVVSVNSTWNSDKINARLGSKQDVISDLASIRSGANLGRTALQEVPAEYINETELNTTLNTRLSSYATTASVESGLATKANVYALATVPEIQELFAFQPNNEFWYTTNNNVAIDPTSGTLGTIVSNTYNEGKGIIVCSENITTIGQDAFRGYQNLSTVKIPGRVTVIDYRAFDSCKGLVSITMPEGLLTIGERAFNMAFNTAILKLVIPDTVTSIGNRAFYNCGGIHEVTIGKSVTNIGNSAFSMCYNLEIINFTGTMAQWNAITKGTDWHKYAGSSGQVTPPTVVHCSDGDVNL